MAIIGWEVAINRLYFSIKKHFLHNFKIIVEVRSLCMCENVQVCHRVLFEEQIYCRVTVATSRRAFVRVSLSGSSGRDQIVFTTTFLI